MSGQEWWDKEVFAGRKANLDLRVKAIAALRRFFEELGYVEVETPALQISPGMEPHLKVFATRLDDPFGGPSQPLYLHTSPEFAMKKLVVAGMDRIFQIAKVYRNAERSPTHHPEFTMVEWYRTGAGIAQLMDETESLITAMAQAVGVTAMTRGQTTSDLSTPWERLSVADAFQRYAGIDILATAPDPLSPDRDLLAAQSRRIGVSVSPTDRWDDIFFKIMMDRIEGRLGHGRPTFLHSYPISMAALARPNAHDPRVADRFELYACGVELANAFDELTDAVEQRRRFEADMDLREEIYGDRLPIDEGFLAALAHGMPQTAGIALGLDRVIMLLAGAQKLEDVLWAPVL
jgi:lysyl-tRNA synthetase class 2